MNRYSVSGAESEYQPGSNDEVLANKLGLTSAADMDEAELQLLGKLYERVLGNIADDQMLSVAMLKEWHRQWLGNLYAWAGEERSVNIAKGNFMFAAAAQIPRLLATFERDFLTRLTPCHEMSTEQAISAIAEVHVELILIHPFREGNGRISRLLADVMAQQAGIGPLDYRSWEVNKPAYIAAIQTGLGCDYALMTELIRQAANA